MPGIHSINEIKKFVADMSSDDLAEFRRWFKQFDAARWKRQDEQEVEAKLTYPTRLVPAVRLDKLTDLISIGGDALRDSEALYDPDSD